MFDHFSYSGKTEDEGHSLLASRVPISTSSSSDLQQHTFVTSTSGVLATEKSSIAAAAAVRVTQSHSSSNPNETSEVLSPESDLSPITPEDTGAKYIATADDHHIVLSPATAPISTLDNTIKGLGDATIIKAETNTVMKEVDPATIFVGGLAMHGVDAWDETKVQEVFGRYGMIEDVKVIRPGMYDANTDLPAGVLTY